MVKKKLQISLALFLYGIFVSAASEHVVYPAGGGNCPTPPCLTLDDYLSNAFTSHSSFLFLPGQHSLNTTLRLENLENVTLRATEAGAIITVSPHGGVVCDRIYDFTISSLEIHCSGALYFENSDTLNILNTHFLGIRYYKSIALHWRGSTGRVVNCSFSSFSGSAIIAVSSKISFNHVNYFINNRATDSGGAVYSKESELDFSGNVSFIGNTAPEGGVLTAVNSVVSFKGMTSFVNNQADIGGAVCAVYSRLKISGNVDFSMNHALKGGAVYLDTGSPLELQSPVAVSFHNNTAVTRGGALLVEDSICENNLFKTCFYEVQYASSTPTEDIFLEFTGNSANAGSVLYGGALDDCKVWVNGVQQDFTGFQFLKNVTIISNNNSIPAITSDPYRICLCTTDGEIECDKHLTYHEIVIPGRRFDVALAAVGQANTTISARIETKPYYSDNIDEKVPFESNSFIPSKCTNVTFQATSDSEDIDIDVFPHGCNAYDKTLRIHVDLVPCPNGFSLNNSKCSCSASLNHNLVVECDVQTGLISHAGSYWIQPGIAHTKDFTGALTAQMDTASQETRHTQYCWIFLQMSTILFSVLIIALALCVGPAVKVTV